MPNLQNIFLKSSYEMIHITYNLKLFRKKGNKDEKKKEM